MKKTVKGLLAAAALVAVPAAVNAVIFKRAQKRARRENEKSYKWRHGKVRYTVTGEGEPLLLVHGMYPGASLAEWDKCAASLARHCRVYALDLLGFGYSDKPAISYSAYLQVMLINDFVRQVIGRRVTAAAPGGSGALVAMAYYFEPDLYGKMLLISPTGIGASGRKLPRNGDTWLKWLLDTPVIGTSVYNFICSRARINGFSRTPGDENYYSAHYGGANARFSLAALLTNFMNVCVEHVLPKINIPLRVLWGSANTANTADSFELIKRLCPQAELTVFKDAGELPHMDNPRAFCNLCREFI
ncbi:MAG: alpha/beta fold hydrolase [Clostridiales bacterium]|nr:alpha/beta fold hydrolase [Clostridiales bacterium]